MSDEGLRFVPAASVSLEAYAAAFTSAFRGYQFPVEVNAEWLARRVRIEQHDLQQSLVAYEGDSVVGVAGLAIRGYAGWVCGFGVVPERRGRGLGREMMAVLTERARACGLRRLSLEVLARNEAARRLYEGVGMRVSRDLLMLERAGPSAEGGAARELKEAAPAELLGHFARLHAEPPAWQRDLPSLLAGRSRGFYLGERARPRAYALLSESIDGNTYVSDLAASDPRDARELSAALGGVAGTLKILNEPEHSLFIEPLLARGFTETDRQHEMVISL